MFDFSDLPEKSYDELRQEYSGDQFDEVLFTQEYLEELQEGIKQVVDGLVAIEMVDPSDYHPECGEELDEIVQELSDIVDRLKDIESTIDENARQA